MKYEIGTPYIDTCYESEWRVDVTEDSEEKWLLFTAGGYSKSTCLERAKRLLDLWSWDIIDRHP